MSTKDGFPQIEEYEHIIKQRKVENDEFDSSQHSYEDETIDAHGGGAIVSIPHTYSRNSPILMTRGIENETIDETVDEVETPTAKKNNETN